MAHTNIQLAIVDDQKLFLRGLRYILSEFDNMDIMMEAHDGFEFTQKLNEGVPDVVLLDLKMPHMDGIETTKYIRKHVPQLKVILLTMHDDERLITHMMEIGANGYLLKDEEPNEVKKAIESVYEKGFYFNEYVSKALLRRVKSNDVSKAWSFSTPIRLTPREAEVLKLICQEYTTAEIADKLFISARTVEGHRKNMIEKTGVRNTTGLVVFALQHKLVVPDP